MWVCVRVCPRAELEHWVRGAFPLRMPLSVYLVPRIQFPVFLQMWVCVRVCPRAELEHWVLSASPLGMPMGPACYADSPDFTRSTAVADDAGKRFALDEDEVRMRACMRACVRTLCNQQGPGAHACVHTRKHLHWTRTRCACVLACMCAYMHAH